MSEKLKPCPRCNSSEVKLCSEQMEGHECFYIKCECGIKGAFAWTDGPSDPATPDEINRITTHWNTHPALPQSPEREEALKELEAAMEEAEDSCHVCGVLHNMRRLQAAWDAARPHLTKEGE